MKFDIARAWKDEAYRQTLEREQLDALPVHPAGELDEAALAEIYGGEEPNWFGASAASTANENRHHTLAGICDINLFSWTAPVIAIPRLINIAKCEKQVCASV